MTRLFARDPDPIFSQSCGVAVSMLEFKRVGKSCKAEYS
ncbi:hypothetical protein CCACVL1_04120 [Corchorus capsularis]|uniref:Uncharacterized protein n=1 Tax=Corchorus capsularis TaxID=210143 RepID=A0A1R3JUY8_COCAP|nr:hypothetical protein CCACVL1_04120 [Corchorus capsularis]